MFKDEIKIKCEDGEVFDKKQIALAIRNSTLEDELSCSLLDEGILNKCDGCNLKDVCDEIDKAINSYVEKTTKVANSFTFD
ncbi:conserved hypothetical protein [Clostridium neonatale]|uniref:hypothetical protein n=1 Tax=Clostridium neonatale TaxID=137838 RepID=UPI00291B9E01|nr:hypothetical protein [Clostridium neonatale]CAI3238727.1 conserved hypothetical protein [Clostridium neonatale]CAI3539779.1 conserved hypothetical protein [Clostridium neonatale]